MKNVDIAAAGIKRGARWLQGAKRALEDERWDDAVYSSQMAVEQVTKAVLIALGIDFPREHDVGGVFAQLSSRTDLPSWFRDEAPSISETISELAKQRGLAGYGFEMGINAEYFKEYAPQAFERAEKVYKSCVRLINELFRLSLS